MSDGDCVGEQIGVAVEGMDLFRAFWVAFLAGAVTFVRLSRKTLGMKHNEQCPHCGHKF